MVEERLKELIIKKYGTLKNFTDKVEIPNSTFSNILRRGIINANVLTIIKVCKELSIEPEALADGRIVAIDHVEEQSTEIMDIFEATKQTLLNSPSITLGGIPATAQQITSLVNSMEVAFEVWKTQNKK